MKDEQLKTYWSNEVARLLDISTSTLRKWSIALEAEGYVFLRDENDKRAYLEHDIMPLQKMRELLNEGMGMENAAKAVVLRFADQISESVTMVVPQQDERSQERYLQLIEQNQELKMMLERLEQRIQGQQEDLKIQIQEQQNYIERSLERRDQQLMQLMEDMMNKRKKKWWQVWK